LFSGLSNFKHKRKWFKMNAIKSLISSRKSWKNNAVNEKNMKISNLSWRWKKRANDNEKKSRYFSYTITPNSKKQLLEKRIRERDDYKKQVAVMIKEKEEREARRKKEEEDYRLMLLRQMEDRDRLEQLNAQKVLSQSF
jgi:hypothetical protein